MYDIALIGLGPAGATFARLLNRDISVIAIDKKSADESGGFQKPCSGLLASDAQKALSKSGLALPKDILVDPQIFAVKTIDLKQDITRYYQRFYINIDRNKFDKWLISLIPANIETAKDAFCKSVKKIDGGYEVKYIQSDEEKTIRAKYVVGADGSNSLIRKTFFKKKNIRQYLSIQQYFRDVNPKPFYSCFFDPDITGCYCWSLPKDGFFILGGAFPKKEGKKYFDFLKSKIENRGYILGEPVITQACLVSRPKRRNDLLASEKGAFLIGEAAGFISPSSLEGISYALESAAILAKTFNKNGKNPGRLYRKRTRAIRIKLMTKHLKSQFMYRPFLRKLVMRSGIKTIKIENED